MMLPASVNTLNDHRLVEAFAEALHADIRRTLWGFAPDEKVLQSLELD
jgi:cobalamin-dependent methionine synthase I